MMRDLEYVLSFRALLRRFFLGAIVLGLCSGARAGAAASLPDDPAIATVDLATREGLRSVSGMWRYRDARVVPARFVSPGRDGQPGSTPADTYEIEPAAGGASFDDSSWPSIEGDALGMRRGNGRLSFNWYRLTFVVPERIGGIALDGTAAVFETSVDDYAEVWIDGELTREPAQSGGSVVAGWNATNRLVVSRHVHPGQKIVVAVFGANGPLSDPPTNFVYVRSAKLSFHASPAGAVAVMPAETNVQVIRKNAALDAIVGPNPKLYKIAEGFEFTEGPVWDRAQRALFFSDPNSNVVYRYAADGSLSVVRRNSGYDGQDIGEYHQPGSNGLGIDREGRLVLAEHGRHRISRVEHDGETTVLASDFDGKRLNSPNDLVLKSDGAVYFTDPPFGLPKVFDDARKELPFSGIYRVASPGHVELLASDLTGPNGIAFSPDERFLYVGDWDEKKKVVMRYPVLPDGKLGSGEVFFDMTPVASEHAIDGIEVDVRGNLYVSGPRGLWILSSSGTHLGTIVTPRHVHNMAWGDDGRTLYLCASSSLYRMPLGVPGLGAAQAGASRETAAARQLQPPPGVAPGKENIP
jgi:gluconolactonase